MKLVSAVKYDIEALVRSLQSLVGKQIWIAESITRNRQVGHDRHFAASSSFMMNLKYVGWSISGGNFHLDGTEGFSYGLSSENIIQFSVDDMEHITITEHFENKTERETKLWVARPSQVG